MLQSTLVLENLPNLWQKHKPVHIKNSKRIQMCSFKVCVRIVTSSKNPAKYQTLLNDGAKRNRLLYLKIMYTAITKILHLP